MLRTYGTEIICIDGTHGTNAYGFELSTIVVLDDQHQGFPVLFSTIQVKVKIHTR
jgi:hypothetical protein